MKYIILILCKFFCLFQYHQKDCKYILINCEHPNCDIKVQRQLLDNHMDRCSFRPTHCEYCNEIIIFKELKVREYIFNFH